MRRPHRRGGDDRTHSAPVAGEDDRVGVVRDEARRGPGGQGALERAADKVQKELQRQGLEVTVNPDSDAIRVVSKTRSGDQFTVVLNRGRSPSWSTTCSGTGNRRSSSRTSRVGHLTT